MAISANGCIADTKGNTPWSDDEWKQFQKHVNGCGNMVIGRKTYEVMAKGKAFDAVNNPSVVVVSRSLKIKNKNGFTVVQSPQQALLLLKKAGYKTITVAGGTQLNSAFIKQGLVDEMILDIEPVLIGKGMPLLASSAFMQSLKLLGTSRYKGGISLRYGIIKS